MGNQVNTAYYLRVSAGVGIGKKNLSLFLEFLVECFAWWLFGCFLFVGGG